MPESENPLFVRFAQADGPCFVARIDGRTVALNASLRQRLSYPEPPAGASPDISPSSWDGQAAALPERLLRFESLKEESGFFAKLKGSGRIDGLPAQLVDAGGRSVGCLLDIETWKLAGQSLGFVAYARFDRSEGEVPVQPPERPTSEHNKNLMASYLSDDLIEYIRRTGEDPLANSRRQATILFFDIRQSTTIAEKLEPEVFAAILSDLFTDVMDLVYGNHGSVNKMLGDGLMATFGCPIVCGNDAENAVRAALQIHEYLQTFNDVRPDALAEPLNAGLGIATGMVFSGVIGSVRRQEYTVLGDAVNVASRLEGITKRVGASIVIDEATRRELVGDYPWRKIPDIELRGRSERIVIYAI